MTIVIETIRRWRRHPAANFVMACFIWASIGTNHIGPPSLHYAIAGVWWVLVAVQTLTTPLSEWRQLWLLTVILSVVVFVIAAIELRYDHLNGWQTAFFAALALAAMLL